MSKPQIIIKVEGGVVQNIYADQELDVKLLDMDNLRDSGSDRINEQYFSECNYGVEVMKNWYLFSQAEQSEWDWHVEKVEKALKSEET